jgi:intein/homing endonuclease
MTQTNTRLAREAERECLISEYFDVNRAGIAVPETIVKRDGRIVSFDIGRIERAMERCFGNLGQASQTPIPELARRVVNILAAKANGSLPTVEGVQDIVEMVLQAAGEFDAAKHYILYRAEHARKRDERPIPDDVRRAFAESDQFFPTPLQKFQFFDKYSRFNYELGRRETWVETVDRTVAFLHELAGSRLPAETYERIRQAILHMRAMPSMRLLAMAGAAARRSNITLYNCSYQPVESIDSFVEALIISMSGCGVGFSVESRYVENFPRVKRQTGSKRPVFVVPDSAEGWAEALRLGLETWFEGGDMRFDLSQLRPAGAPLRTKGGRASGPEPLRLMLRFVRSRILARQGSFIRPIDAHDMMCAVGNAAVSGGVRRTAMISLFDHDDSEMLQCKNGEFDHENSQRWNANNSAVWPEGGLTQIEFIKKFVEMVESGRGEPGIFNREAARAMRPERREVADFGINPCITGDTWVLTDQGPRQVADLVGIPHTTLVDGLRYPTTDQGFWENGVKPILLLTTSEGYTLRLTANHQVLAVPHISSKTERTTWVEAGTLQPGDKIKLHNHREATWEGDGTFDEGWLLGSLVGDGTFDYKTALLTFWGEHRAQMAEHAVTIIHQTVHARADLTSHDQSEYDRTVVQSAGLRDLAADYGIYRGVKTITPLIEQTSSAFHRGFLQGLFDADGAVLGTQRKGVSVRLAQSDPALLEGVQRMLLRLGITAAIYRNRRPAGTRLLPDGHGGTQEYVCRDNHELVIANDNLQVFAEVVGFSQPAKQTRLAQKLDGYAHALNRERFVVTVKQIEHAGEEMVYDCAVPDINAFDANGLYVHNCGEIVLRPHQFCNLSSAIARVDDTFETLRDKVEVATIIGSIQSMATHFPGLRPIWKHNCEEERLLGVDITGQMDSPISQDAEVKARLKQIAIETNRQTAAALDINPAASLTCVKPSGNSSQMVDCASGLHARWAPYYIRNVRVATYSPIFKVLRDAGVPMDPENGQTPEDANTWVVHFPVKAPDGAITRNDRTAIEQCEYWLQNKVHWTEHNPSVTITYRPDEVIDLMKWVWEHRDKLGGITFLPSFDAHYAQMPYEEIDREKYERLMAAFPPIDFSKIYRYEEKDLTNLAQEMACFSGTCEIDTL